MRAVQGTTIAILLLAGAWLAAPAAAQHTPRKAVIGEPAPDLLFRTKEGNDNKERERYLLERHRRKIVLLFFFRTTDLTSMDVLPEVLKVAADYHRKGVYLIFFSDENKDKAESVFKGKIESVLKEKQFGIDFIWGIDFDEPYNVSAPPRVYMVDTAGILVDHFHPADRLVERLTEQIRRTPPVGTSPEELRKALSAARAQVEAKEYGRAYTLVKDVVALTEKESDIGKEAAEQLKKVEEAGRKWLDEARQAVKDKDNAKGFRILAELSVRFEGTDLAKDADIEISKLMADRELKNRINKAKDNARGEMINEEAAELATNERYIEALARYTEVSEKYPDTDAGKAAEKALEEIRADPKVQTVIAELRAEQEAERWLDLGERYARVQLYKKAREYYEKVIAAHGDTRSAARARELLNELPAEDPAEESQKPVAQDKPARSDKP